jgi:hypothetical protein
MEEIAPLDAYLSGPGMLRAAVTGMSREQMIARPITGRWSVLEVLCRTEPALPCVPVERLFPGQVC